MWSTAREARTNSQAAFADELLLIDLLMLADTQRLATTQ